MCQELRIGSQVRYRQAPAGLVSADREGYQTHESSCQSPYPPRPDAFRNCDSRYHIIETNVNRNLIHRISVFADPVCSSLPKMHGCGEKTNWQCGTRLVRPGGYVLLRCEHDAACNHTPAQFGERVIRFGKRPCSYLGSQFSRGCHLQYPAHVFSRAY